MTRQSFTRESRYYALREVTYPDSNGKLVHAKVGDIVIDYPPSSARCDVRDGVIEHIHEEKRKEAEE